VEPIFAVAFFLFGLAFGSFLNVCIYRIPLALPPEEPGETALRATLASLAAWGAVGRPARSFCPLCRHPIRWYDNLPVVSWLGLHGRCRDCGARISFRYAVVELLTAALFLGCYVATWRAWNAPWTKLEILPVQVFGNLALALALAKLCLFSFLVVGLIFIDAEHRLLPDAFTLPGTLLALLLSALTPIATMALGFSASLPGRLAWTLASFLNALTGALVGAAFIYGAGLLYKLMRHREGMGLGDVKLMAMVGAFLGWKLALLTIFGASLLGAAFGIALILLVWVRRWRRNIHARRGPGLKACRRAWHSALLVRYYAMPFGVFLGAVALFNMFFGSALLRWYGQTMGIGNWWLAIGNW
jgi:leader peptidase (prepilin peptidase)/N-methyltransferase